MDCPAEESEWSRSIERRSSTASGKQARQFSAPPIYYLDTFDRRNHLSCRQTITITWRNYIPGQFPVCLRGQFRHWYMCRFCVVVCFSRSSTHRALCFHCSTNHYLHEKKKLKYIHNVRIGDQNKSVLNPLAMHVWFHVFVVGFNSMRPIFRLI